MTSTQWLRADRTHLAREQILDAAGLLFADHGVGAVGMAEVAIAAGCSRATLYRYFENRDSLRTAFVQREARRIGVTIAAEVADITDPRERVLSAMVSALRLVRDDTTLAAWFSASDAGDTAVLAQSSAVIAELVTSFLGGEEGGSTRRRAAWVVRVLVSLLADPAGDQERELLEEFVLPVVVGAS